MITITFPESLPEKWQFKIGGVNQNVFLFEEINRDSNRRYGQYRSTVEIDCPSRYLSISQKGYLYLHMRVGGNTHGWALYWDSDETISDSYYNGGIEMGHPIRDKKSTQFKGTGDWIWDEVGRESLFPRASQWWDCYNGELSVNISE